MASNISEEEVKYVESYFLNLKKLQEEFFYVNAEEVEDEFHKQDLNYDKTRLMVEYKNQTKAPTEPDIHRLTRLKERGENIELVPEDPQLYRIEATVQYQQQRECLKMAKEAINKGHFSTATEYEVRAHKHKENFEISNRRAGQKILDAVNKRSDENTLDLHYLEVNEAVREAEYFLSKWSNCVGGEKVTVTIITGRGAHSSDGQAKLKPAIRDLLERNGNEFVDHPGHFEIIL